MNENEQKILSPDNNDSAEKRAEKRADFSIVKPLRTFEQDIAESIREKNASVASINVMEQKKREEKREVSVVEKAEGFAWGSVALLTSIVLIIAAVGTVGFLFFAHKDKTVPVVTPQYSIISTDQIRTVDVTNKNRAEIVGLLAVSLKDRVADLSITELKIVETLTFDEKVGPEEKQISSEKFISTIGQSAPASLSRAFEGPWMFGFYNSNFAEPFILARLGSFDNAYDGMIKWEKDIATDFGKLFIERDLNIGTSTEKISPILNSNFEDIVIKSKNVRALRDSVGNIVLLYSFLNEEYIVITTNDSAFREILNRFLTSKLVR